MQIAHLTAEPASIFYILTGAIGILVARLRTSGQHNESSVFMLFCRRSTREKLRHINDCYSNNNQAE